MVEGALLLSMILRRFRVQTVHKREPVPEAHLTVRSKDGIWLELQER